MAAAASGNPAVGTIKVVTGDVRVIGVDGVARQVQIGDKVFAKETIQTAANAVVQVQLENGRTLDLGRDSRIALDDDILSVGQTPTTAPATGDIAAVQAQIAAGADPAKVAAATAAGSAPGAGGAGDGGGGTPVVIDQANSKGGVSSGFDTAPASIAFPGPLQNPLLPTPQVRVSINDVTVLEPTGRFAGRGESQSDGVSSLALTVPGPGEGGNSLVNGLGGAAGFGENFFFRNDDGSTDLIDISSIFPGGMNFFGTNYNGFYINNNGNITFDSPLGTFTPFGITANNGGSPMIAPFFADFDTRPASSHVSPGGTSTGTNAVYWDLDTANGVITITWDDVGYYDQQTNLVNAVQLRIFATGGGNFGFEFRYENVEWTTGGASGGSGGLGGSVAHAGWTAGDGINFYELPQSGNQNAILNLETTSNPNTPIDGNWVFNVVGGQVVDTPTDATTTAIFTVSLDQVATQDVFVSFTTADGSAISGGSGISQHDYGATSGIVRIPAGQISATIQVTIFGDGVSESIEQFYVNLTGIVSGPAVIADNQGVGTIVDVTPTLSISDGTPVALNEGLEGGITFTVTLSSPVDHEITVDYSTVDGTAVADGGEGGDYFTESGVITFAPGETTQSITVFLRDDRVFEDPEAFTVQLSNASPGATIADNSGTGNISDDDPPPTEGGEGVVITGTADEIVDGTAFNDTLSGVSYAELNGLGGDDILESGWNNVLNGGSGNDTYRFTDLGEGMGGNSIGGNFTIGNPASDANADTLDVHDLLGGVAGLAAAVSADDAATVGLYIQFDVSGTTATLQVDTDGAGADSAQDLATFTVPDGTTSASLLATLLNNNQIAV